MCFSECLFRSTTQIKLWGMAHTNMAHTNTAQAHRINNFSIIEKKIAK